jgi:hypothetical protein
MKQRNGTFPEFSAEKSLSSKSAKGLTSSSFSYLESYTTEASVVAAQQCPPCEPCDPFTGKQECYVWRPAVQECASVMKRCVVYPTPWKCSRPISDPSNCGMCIRAGGCCQRKISADVSERRCA